MLELALTSLIGCMQYGSDGWSYQGVQYNSMIISNYLAISMIGIFNVAWLPIMKPI
jgi:hypothetical protein